MSIQRQADDGTWSPAQPLPVDASSVDVERYSDGRWVAYRGLRELGRGRSRIKLAWLLWCNR